MASGTSLTELTDGLIKRGNMEQQEGRLPRRQQSNKSIERSTISCAALGGDSLMIVGRSQNVT